jgi:hypothetical protein
MNSACYIIHHATGLKVDFRIRKSDDYGREAFASRRQYPYGSRQVSISTPEDLIIAKLDWFRMSDIDKHLADVRGVYAVQRGTLDAAYIRRWCEVKGLSELWHEVEETTQ